jgi:hypothetical protein
MRRGFLDAGPKKPAPRRPAQHQDTVPTALPAQTKPSPADPEATEVFDLMGLPPELFLAVCARLHTNEVTATLRLLCRRARDLLREQTTLRLSQPMPEHAFRAKWGKPSAFRGLSVLLRRELMSLTFKSGVLANARLLVTGSGSTFETGLAGCEPMKMEFTAAGEAGHMDIAKMLLDVSRHFIPVVAGGAARGGHLPLLKWVLQLWSAFGDDSGDPPDTERLEDVLQVRKGISRHRVHGPPHSLAARARQEQLLKPGLCTW